MTAMATVLEIERAISRELTGPAVIMLATAHLALAIVMTAQPRYNAVQSAIIRFVWTHVLMWVFVIVAPEDIDESRWWLAVQIVMLFTILGSTLEVCVRIVRRYGFRARTLGR